MSILSCATWRLEQLGLTDGASRGRLQFDSGIARTCADRVFVQESGPERADLKRDLLVKISAEPRNSLIATSSSGILISDIQDATVYPERIVVARRDRLLLALLKLKA